ncbi:hypothetical protein SFRURICE_017762 [Spodoptera frugiperda]|nr:hypothetical protein SFRURICE_017762 [Spodoptera frugiperda]
MCPMRTASLGEWAQALTTEKGVASSIPKLSKVILGFFWFLENFSLVARSLKLCPVYGNRHPLLHGTYNKNGEKWVYIV